MANSNGQFTLWVSVSNILKSEPSCTSYKLWASLQRWQVWGRLQHGKCPHAATQSYIHITKIFNALKSKFCTINIFCIFNFFCKIIFDEWIDIRYTSTRYLTFDGHLTDSSLLSLVATIMMPIYLRPTCVCVLRSCTQMHIRIQKPDADHNTTISH